MTANQINFARAKEDARHNRVSERHEHYDTRSRRIQAEAAGSQADTARRQLGINWWSAQEVQRANQAREQETYRHNFQQEQLDMYKNMTAAAAAQDRARASLRQAAVSERTATVRESELAEALRRNLVLEGFTRQDLAETARHNRAGESLGFANLGETTRANKARETLEATSIAEQQRHNVEGEKVATSQALSSAKQASAAEQRAWSDASRAGTARMEAESHQRMTDSQIWRNRFDNVKTATSIGIDIARTIGGFLK